MGETLTRFVRWCRWMASDLRYFRHWPQHERDWWWYCNVSYPMSRLRERVAERLHPGGGAPCIDCGLSYRRWWCPANDHTDCLPF